jgi:hypothetical protein
MWRSSLWAPWSGARTSRSQSGIARAEDETSLIGLVEDVEGAVVALRVGDSILLLEAEGEPPLGVLGGMAWVRPRHFELWPTGI